MVVASKEESGNFKIVGEASRGRTSRIKGGPVVTFEPAQLTVNEPHCVAGEYNGVKAAVVTRDERRAKPRKSMRLQLEAREVGISHGNTGNTRELAVGRSEEAQRGAVWKGWECLGGRVASTKVSRSTAS